MLHDALQAGWINQNSTRAVFVEWLADADDPTINNPLDSPQHREARVGVAALCVGGGQGVAMVVESLATS